MKFPISDDRLNELLDVFSQAIDAGEDDKGVIDWIESQPDKDELMKAFQIIIRQSKPA